MKESQRVFKNVLAGGVGTALGGALQFVAVLLLARKLGLSDFGIYSVLATFAFLLSRFADLGTSAILLRDLAVDPRSTRELLSSTLSLAWCLVVGIGCAVTAGTYLIPALFGVRWATILMALSGLLQFPCACYGSVMRAHEDNELEALGFLIHKLALLSMVWIALVWKCDLRGVSIVYVACALIQYLFCRWIVRRNYAQPSWRANLAEWTYLLKESLPYGGAAIVRLVGEQADVTILAWIAGLSAVGLYSAVYRLTIGLRFVPQAMVVGVFPAYSRAGSRFKSNEPEGLEFQRIYEFGFRIFALIGIPLSIMIFLGSKPMVATLLGPAYLSAVPALRILAVAAGVFFVASPFPFLLTALQEQRFLLASSTYATAFRIAMVLVLSWMFGIKGTCVAVLSTETILLCAWIAYLAGKRFSLNVGSMLVKAAIAGSAMATLIVLWNASGPVSWLAVALASTVVYVLILLKLKTFSAEEIALGAEAMNFMKPLVVEWSNRMRPEPAKEI